MEIDAPSLRRALRDFFKFNPKDFYVQGSGTGFLISAAPKRSSAISSAITYGFQWYISDNDGSPDTAGRRIKLYEGIINENIVPDNMASEFELPDDSFSYMRCTTSQRTDGIVTSATLAIETDPAPDDPPGSLGVAPATSSRDLWRFNVASGEITQDIALRIGGIDVKRQVVDISCGEATLQMVWQPAVNHIITDA